MKAKQKVNNKVLGRSNEEAKRMRQRVWAKARDFEIKEYLNRLGHSFDSVSLAC